MSIDPQSPNFRNTPVSEWRPHFDYRPLATPSAPAVSLITPFYNTGDMFHETARSVVQQSLQQWEWIIVNDGSTQPQALAVLDVYRTADARIKVIDHETNRGVSAARNTGYRLASAEYVAQLDSDDLLEPTALEKWRWFLESYPEYGFVNGYSIGFGSQEYLWTKGFHEGNGFLKENLADPRCMVRKAVHRQVGGYDEALRAGFEDWDFWLRCGSHGHWGATIPEYLNWYRRRANHNDRWAAWDGSIRQQQFGHQLREKYSRLWKTGLPTVVQRWHLPNDAVPDALPFDNLLDKSKPRLIMLLPWLAVGGADKFNLDLLDQFKQRGWEITIATTLRGNNDWHHQFASRTPDIFLLSNFLRLIDYPRFLRYLIRSRNADALFLSHSELSYYLLPYLRAYFPHLPIVDMGHMEEEYWKNGGYPRAAVEYQELVDLNIVSSQHLMDWMVHRGAQADKLRVAYTGIDTVTNRPQPELAAKTRKQLNIDPHATVILYAARLVEQKQPRVFARTMNELRRRNVDFVALVAGDGPARDWLGKYVAEHDLWGRVRLLGAVSNERVRELMSAADVYFLPSQMEGIALSVYEAMAHALPIVSASVGGQAELVTPECGVLITRSDEASETQTYASILAGLVAKPNERRRLGAAGRARVEAHFRIETMGDRLSAIVSEASDRCASDPRPQPSLGAARASAALAIEYTRLFDLATQLWNERERPSHVSSRLAWASKFPTRPRLYLILSRRLFPVYRWCVQQGWAWPAQLKDAIKSYMFT